MPKPKSNLAKLFNVQSPFFIPIWRRYLVVGICALWTVVEFANGAMIWALFFAAVTVYLGHQFFIAFDPDINED